MTGLSVVLHVEVNFAGPSSGDWLRLNDAIVGKIGTNTLAPETGAWTDITDYVYSLTITRGSRTVDGPVVQYEAGTASITLDNHDRRFDPTNLDGPYVSGGQTEVEPMREMRISASYQRQGEWLSYELFHGYVDSWDVEFEQLDSRVTLSCTDAFKVLGNYSRPPVLTPAGANELSGARIHRILDSAAWPVSLRRVDTGMTHLQATTLEGSALDEALQVCEAEIGEFYVDGGGYIVFRNRNAMSTDERSATSQATFGDIKAPWAKLINTNPEFDQGSTGFQAFSFADLSVSDGVATVSPTSESLSTVEFGFPTAFRPAVTPGKTYRMTVSFKNATERVDGNRLMFRWYDAGGSSISDSTGAVFTAPTADFASVSFEATAPEGATTVSARIHMLNSPAVGEDMHVDFFRVFELSGELEYSDAPVVYDESTMYNHFRVTRDGEDAVEQVVEIQELIDRYLYHTYEASGLPLMDDAEALRYAQYIAQIGGTPELRFAELKLDPQGSTEFEDLLYPQVLGREIGDRITIVRRPPGGGEPIERDVFIRGITHTVDASGSWETTWSLQSAVGHSWFTIGTANGKLNRDVLGF